MAANYRRCTQNDSTPARCTDEAVVWLIQPDGKRNPLGWLCQKHADAIVQEYAEKLGELWTLEPLNS